MDSEPRKLSEVEDAILDLWYKDGEIKHKKKILLGTIRESIDFELSQIFNAITPLVNDVEMISSDDAPVLGPNPTLDFGYTLTPKGIKYLESKYMISN